MIKLSKRAKDAEKLFNEERRCGGIWSLTRCIPNIDVTVARSTAGRMAAHTEHRVVVPDHIRDSQHPDNRHRSGGGRCGPLPQPLPGCDRHPHVAQPA